MRMSVVVCHMRVLDSYSDWLWTSANTARRRLGGAHSQTTGWASASLCGLLNSLAAGHGASVKREEKAATRGRCRSTIITEETHPSCASSTAL